MQSLGLSHAKGAGWDAGSGLRDLAAYLPLPSHPERQRNLPKLLLKITKPLLQGLVVGVEGFLPSAFSVFFFVGKFLSASSSPLIYARRCFQLLLDFVTPVAAARLDASGPSSSKERSKLKD